MRPFNEEISGIEWALRSAGYPMETEIEGLGDLTKPRITEQDKLRGIRLGKAKIGSGEDKFLRFIIVSFDWTCPRFMWQEIQMYKYLETNSQSTMHRITKMDIDKMCNEYVSDEAKDNLKRLIKCYNNTPTEENWRRLKANVPEGLILTARCITNYAQLKTMYAQRKHHKNVEWREFCHWIEELPMARELGVCGNE